MIFSPILLNIIILFVLDTRELKKTKHKFSFSALQDAFLNTSTVAKIILIRKNYIINVITVMLNIKRILFDKRNFSIFQFFVSYIKEIFQI